MASKADFLVDARWLNEHRNDANLVIVDTRAAKDFWAGHIAGARHFDPFPFHYSESSERGVNEFKAQLVWIFSALGITTRHTVVVTRPIRGCARRGWRGPSNGWAIATRKSSTVG
jgi:3-mercaptopyruvate sulfurtransferase SseA